MVIYRNIKNAEEAESIINGFCGLQCNDHGKRYLANLFNGEDVAYYLKTTGCGINEVRFYPALAPTIEEHERLYKEQKEQAKAEQESATRKRNEELMKDFKAERSGWYRVKVEVCGMSIERCSKRYFDYQGECLANSKNEAYLKLMKSNELENACAGKSLLYVDCSDWNSANTEVEFLGIRK